MSRGLGDVYKRQGLDVYLAGARGGDCYEELGTGQGRSVPDCHAAGSLFFLGKLDVIIGDMEAGIFSKIENECENDQGQDDNAGHSLIPRKL